MTLHKDAFSRSHALTMLLQRHRELITLTNIGGLNCNINYQFLLSSLPLFLIKTHISPSSDIIALQLFNYSLCSSLDSKAGVCPFVRAPNLDLSNREFQFMRLKLQSNFSNIIDMLFVVIQHCWPFQFWFLTFKHYTLFVIDPDYHVSTLGDFNINNRE